MDYPQYDPTTKNLPLSDAELDALDTLLFELPSEQAMNIECMDGYLTALLVGPPLLPRLPTAEWLPAVWGGDGEAGAPFASNKQRKRATVLVLRHLNAIAHQLREAPERWEPIFSVAETKEREVVDAEMWCIGFLHGVALDREGWGPLFDDPALSEALVPVALLGGEESQLSEADQKRLADPDQRDDLSRAVMDAVLVLNERRGAG